MKSSINDLIRLKPIFFQKVNAYNVQGKTIELIDLKKQIQEIEKRFLAEIRITILACRKTQLENERLYYTNLASRLRVSKS